MFIVSSVSSFIFLQLLSFCLFTPATLKQNDNQYDDKIGMWIIDLLVLFPFTIYMLNIMINNNEIYLFFKNLFSCYNLKV